MLTAGAERERRTGTGAQTHAHLIRLSFSSRTHECQPLIKLFPFGVRAAVVSAARFPFQGASVLSCGRKGFGISVAGVAPKHTSNTAFQHLRQPRRSLLRDSSARCLLSGLSLLPKVGRCPEGLTRVIPFCLFFIRSCSASGRFL